MTERGEKVAHITSVLLLILINTYGERDWREWHGGLHRGRKAFGKCHGPMQLNLNTACFFVNVTIKVAQSLYKG